MELCLHQKKKLVVLQWAYKICWGKKSAENKYLEEFNDILVTEW